MKLFGTIKATLLITLFSAFSPAGHGAEAPNSIDQVLSEAKQAQTMAQRQQQQREQQFLAAGDKQKAIYAQMLTEAQTLNAEVEALETKAKANEQALIEQRQQLKTQLGTYDDLYALIRQVAGDTARDLDDSLISGELSGRSGPLSTLKGNPELPEFQRISEFWLTLLGEMKAQSEVKSFTAPLIVDNGEESVAEITRIGPFSAVHNGRYVEYVSNLGKFRELGRQPGAKFIDAANNLERHPEEAITAAAIDPSRGSILSLLVQTPSLSERLHQGGLVGYIIMGLAAFGFLLALTRILMLKRIAAKVERQKQSIDLLREDNPLGRVLLAVKDHGADETEIIERKLDESILKEMPSLEWGLSLIKLLAAIAPLLGLLGTVVGMILTFQAISLFGSGDPKLMAGGISQALVTTVLGLSTAIPLLLLHSVAGGTSRRVEQTLEEQAAALVAERIEGARP